jgi:hypothetical protein
VIETQIPLKCVYAINNCDIIVDYTCQLCIEEYQVDIDGGCNICNGGHITVLNYPFTYAKAIENCEEYENIDSIWICKRCVEGRV